MKYRSIRFILIFVCFCYVSSVQAAELTAFVGVQNSVITIPSSNFTNANEDDGETAEAGVKLSLSEYFNISLKTMRSTQEDAYKVGERAPNWLDLLLGSDTSIYAHVDKEVRQYSINCTFLYSLESSTAIYSSLGVSKWESWADVSDPISGNISESDSGVGYNYGIGAIVSVRHNISFSAGASKYVLAEITITSLGITAEYKF